MAVKCSDGKVYAGVKWVCTGIGLSEGQFQNQTRKINDDIVVSRGIAKIQLPTKSGDQEVECIELNFLPLWLAKINAKIIKDPVVQKNVVEYQIKAKDVLANAFIQTVQPPVIIEDETERNLVASINSHNEVDFTDSRDIALMTEKRHAHIMKDIQVFEGVISANPNLRSGDFFMPSTYIDAQGQERPKQESRLRESVDIFRLSERLFSIPNL